MSTEFHEMEPMKGGKYIAVVLCVFVFFCFATPAYLIGSGRSNFLNSSETTTGVVVGFKKSKSSLSKQRVSKSDAILYQTIVRYTTLSGEVVESPVGVASNINFHSLGDELNIVYNPKDVQEAEIKSFFQIWKVPMILMLLGFPFGLCAVYILVKEIF